FIDFGKQLANPVKFIKQNTAFLPKPIQQVVVFAVIFAGLPLFILGFFILRIWAYKHISLYSEYKDMANSEISSKDTDLKSLFSDDEEQEDDEYQYGYDGPGIYLGNYRVDE
ncbi:TPA: hypothetical protein PXD29_002686, partial [Mannheimia haemolytica]|nr:hypothetical protein [Mannheimia haemolytica]